jgi:Protein of unknown function (DUF2815)
MANLYAGNGGKPIWNEFLSPIGRFVHCYHDKPQMETNEQTKAPILDENGVQKAQFKVSLMWPKAYMDSELIPMCTMAALTRNQAWGEAVVNDSWFRLEPFLRDGDNPGHNTKKKEYLFGHVYLNFKAKAIPQKQPDGRVIYTGAPDVIGPYKEDLFATDLYAGCTGRVSGIMFGTEYSGRNFISVRLNNIQKAADGERIGGGERPDAKSQFDALASMPAGGGLGNIL